METDPNRPQDDGGPADHERSGANIEEAVARAEAGSDVTDVHEPPQDSAPGSAAVEQTYADPEMTEGQVIDGDGDADRPQSPDPSQAGSGGAQSQVGARADDRRAAGEKTPITPPFD